MLSKLKIKEYSCIETLLDNEMAGRTTYLAQDKEGKNVVLKKFEFSTPRASWAAYNAMEKEVKFLALLDYPQIPKYLDYFEIESGFVLAIEYVNASHLGCFRKHFSFEEVKKIAIDILEILVYLQQQNPPIVHRDIKPENILWDGKKAYLIDFGIATTASYTMTMTSTLGGTLCFSAPEILQGRKAMLNSDLYSLGATLFCLLHNISSKKITDYINVDFSFKWDKIERLSNHRFLSWLKSLTNPNHRDRYSEPQAALTSLKMLDLQESSNQNNWSPESKSKKAKVRLPKADNLQKLPKNPLFQGGIEIENFDQQELVSHPLQKHSSVGLLKIQKDRSQITKHKKCLWEFDRINIVVTIFLGTLGMVLLSPTVFLGINIFQKHISIVYWSHALIYSIAVFWSRGVVDPSNYPNDEDYVSYEMKNAYSTGRICARYLNVTLRVMEAICFCLILINGYKITWS